MKKLLCIMLCCTPVVLAKAQESKLSSLKWLLGTWKNLQLSTGEEGFESWYSTSSGEFQGVGVTLKNSDTTFIERLRLTIKNEKLYYVADVAHNEAPVYFEVINLSEAGFTCENPQHDFPKKIEYTRSEEELQVTISGNGKSSVFKFKKIPSN